MDLSIVIVNWNAALHLRRCLDSVSNLLDEVREIVVFDNHSGDASLQVAREAAGVRLVEKGTNLGFAAAANEAIALTSSPFILLLNPDTLVRPRSVRRLYESMRKSPVSGLGCGPLCSEDGTPQTGFQFRELPTAWSVLADVLGVEELVSLLASRPRISLQSGPLSASLQPAAAYWMIRRQTWNELEGFDERFWPAWFEDVDFCKRLQFSRWRVLYDDSAGAVHIGGVSVERLGRRRFTRVFYRNLLRYLRKHHPASFPFLWLPVQMGSLFRRILSPPHEAARIP